MQKNETVQNDKAKGELQNNGGLGFRKNSIN
jgi:hypothetical protein